MLEGLKKIRWHHLSTADGSGANIPQWLHELRDPNPDVSKGAFTYLQIALFDDSFVRHATSYTIPFLIELIADPTTPERMRLLQFLKWICDSPYQSYNNVGPEIAYRQWRKRTQRALLDGVPVYVRLLEDRELSLEAAEMLARLPEYYEDSEPLIRARAAENPVLIHPLIRLWRVLPLTDERKSRMLEWMRDSKLMVHIRLKAALAVIAMTGEGYFEETLPLFDQVMASGEWVGMHPALYRQQMMTLIYNTLQPIFPREGLAWIVRYIDDADVHLRQNILFCLSFLERTWRWGSKAAEPYYLRMLNDPAPSIRWRVLSSFTPPPDVLETLPPDQLKAVEQRLKAVPGIENPYEGQSLSPLLSQLHNALLDWEDNARLFPDLLPVIGRLKNRDALPVLKRLLRHEANIVNVNAARAIWEIDPSTAELILPVLRQSLEDCADDVLVALECLGLMGKQAVVIPRLHEMINSERRLAYSVELDDQLQEAAKRTLELIEKV